MPSVQGDSDAILCSSSCWPLLALGELNNLRALSDYLVVLSTSAGRFWLSTSQCGILPATSFPLSEYDRINFLQYLLCSAPAILAERIHSLIPQTRTIYCACAMVCVCSSTASVYIYIYIYICVLLPIAAWIVATASQSSYVAVTRHSVSVPWFKR
jgi:hypothetical protein